MSDDEFGSDLEGKGEEVPVEETKKGGREKATVREKKEKAKLPPYIVEQTRKNLDINNGWQNVLRPQDVEKYMSKLQQYAINTPFSIEAPEVKGKQECPTTNGESWNVFLKPIPALDKHLGQQWVIHRKDYKGKNTKLFCYPKKDFNGKAVEMPTDQEPVDLDLFTYS